MPSNKNALARIAILDKLLGDQYKHYTVSDLTEKVNEALSRYDSEAGNIVERTIQKDIVFMEDYFHADIMREKKYGLDRRSGQERERLCVRYSDPSFSIFKQPLTDDEKYLLRETFSLIGQFDGLPNLEGLEKLRLSLGMKDNDSAPIISFTKNPLEGSNLLGKLFTFISHKLTIVLHYHTFAAPDNIKEIDLYPYLLKEYNRRWFLLAAAVSDMKMLVFPLDRIDNAKGKESIPYKEYDENINEYFDDIIGVTNIKDSPVYEIYFWVSDRSKDYVLTKPLHDSQRTLMEDDAQKFRKRYPDLKDGKYFRIDCKYNYELIRELSSFGADLIVVSPKEIRDAIIERLRKMFETYKIACL